ncbi:MAG: 50S ribosomal protein L25 [Gammaproteobacteria bacterium]|nr:MAG: 50S ribosomal protein L25 [Gammaproteobacteria bacterium]RLA16637.1 MAG: 50S ribosomal protein L25 [Gammaproteobacteria bacterium]
MSVSYEINAELRDVKGKGASRRLRHADKIPAIVYGEGSDPLSLTLDHNDIWVKLQQEAFHSHILTLNVAGKSDNVIMRDIQYHPYKQRVMHLDFLRIAMDHALQTSVPLHFINEDIAIGVKLHGGVISHLITDVEIECMPADLPEYIEVDMAELEIDQSLHLSDLKLPNGVTLLHLDESHDQAVVSIHKQRTVVEVDETDVVEEEGESTDESEGGDKE